MYMHCTCMEYGGYEHNDVMKSFIIIYYGAWNPGLITQIILAT